MGSTLPTFPVHSLILLLSPTLRLHLPFLLAVAREYTTALTFSVWGTGLDRRGTLLLDG